MIPTALGALSLAIWLVLLLGRDMFWLARERDGGGPAEWAAFAARTLADQGQALVAGGAPLQGEAAQAALQAQAVAFADTVLPCWRGLGIA